MYFPSPAECDAALPPSFRGRKILSSPGNSSAVRRHCASNSQSPAVDFLFMTAPPTSPLWVSPSFVLKGLHAVHCSCMSPVTILRCSCINPFCWWNNWLFYCFRLTLPLRILCIWYLSRRNCGLIITNF